MNFYNLIHVLKRFKKLLNRGYKYIPLIDKDVQEKMVVSVEAANINNNIKMELQSKINGIINQKNKLNKKQLKEKSIIRKINDKIRNENLVVTSEDKGPRFVILKKDEYEKKINDDMEKQGYLEMNKDPGNKIRTKYKILLNNMRIKKLINEQEYRHLYPTVIEHPHIFGKIKTQKEGMPARVILNFKNYILKGLCDILYKKMLNSVGFGKYCIKSSEEIVDKLKNMKLNRNGNIVSFDIEKMYQSIPRDESIKIMINKIRKCNNMAEEWIDVINEALCLISNSLYFKYKNRFWEIKKGWVMGCSISGVLSSILIEFIEESIVDKYIKMKEILQYHRYVDDIIVIGNSRCISNVFIELNNNTYNIKFTMENGSEGLRYLDIFMKKDEQGEIIMKHYIKEKDKRGIINPGSYQSWSQKIAAIKGFTIKNNRLTLNKEEALVQRLEVENDYVSVGYKRKDINRLFRNNDDGNKNSNRKSLDINSKWISLPYVNKVYKELTKRKLNDNIKIGWKNNKSLGKWITSIMDDDGDVRAGLVYKIVCKFCSKVYIGQTAKTALERGKEHDRAIKRKDIRSGPYVHFLNTGHIMDCSKNIQVIKYVKNFQKRKCYETLYIQENFEKCMNLVKGPVQLGGKWVLLDNWKV